MPHIRRDRGDSFRGNETAPGYVVGREACAFVAQLLGKDGRRNPEKQERADAFLLAAAPELLAVLKGVLKDCDALLQDKSDLDQYDMAEAFASTCRAAIAKAKGNP